MKLKVTHTAIQNACVMVVCIWALTPQLAFSGGARLASVGAVAVWLLLEAGRPNGIIRAPTSPALLMFVYSGYTILLEFLTHGSAGVISSIQTYIMLFFLLVQQARRKAMDSLHPVFWLVIGLYIFSITSTYMFLSSVDARAMRTLVRSSAEARELIEQGVGGYGMAYGAVLLLPVLTVLSLRPAMIDSLNPPRLLTVFPFMPKLTIWYLTIISLVLILMSQFSIAVLTMTVCMMVTLIVWRLTVLRLFIAVFATMILLFFGKALLIQTLSELLPYAEGTNYQLKINDLLYSIQVEASKGTAENRIDRYTRSLSLFFGSPLFGVLYFTDVGKHSTLLDNFARWGGIIGAILLYLVSFLQVRALKTLSSIRGGAGAALGSLAAVILIFGLNSDFMSAGIVIFIIYPIIFRALKLSAASREGASPRSAHA